MNLFTWLDLAKLSLFQIFLLTFMIVGGLFFVATECITMWFLLKEHAKKLSRLARDDDKRDSDLQSP